jgi:3-deoxy-manno-octulosonate cytidylyltransferase (CMP-KDO synthetase)
MSTLIVIPSRLGATRLPQKPLRTLGGKPLIVRVLERVQSLGLGAAIVVATDSPEVADVVRAAGGDVAMTRADHPSGTDRVAEVAQAAGYAAHDVIVNVQGDEPFVTAETVRAAASQVQSGAFALGTAACHDDAAILDKPDVVKVVTDSTGRALYFSRAAVPHLRDESDRARRDALVLRHIGVYAYTREALLKWVALPQAPLEIAERLEQLRPMFAGIAMGVGITATPGATGIDTEEDLRRANEAWLETAIAVNPPVPAGIR